MKKLFSVLMLGLMVAPLTQAATVKISNLTASGKGAYGITNTEGVLIGAGAGSGVIGRMTLNDAEIQDLLEEEDMQAVYNAFVPFGPSGSNTFALNNLGYDGVFEASLSQATTANDFGNRPIYVWLYAGATRSSASNFILAKLSQNFPTDTQQPPETLEVFLRPEATFLAGVNNGAPHDYLLPDGDGPQATLKMRIQPSINQPPVAVAGTLSLERGQFATGTVTATDAENDALTYSVVTEPTKGTVVINTNGTYTYTSTAGTTGNDSFTFRAYDSISYSESAEVVVSLTDTPPGPSAPSITLSTMDSGYVGSFYEFQIPIANLPQGEATSFTAKGLPGGLKLDTKTGIISGYPTAAVTGKAVVLSAKNAQGSSGNVSVTVTIEPVPVGAVGTYIARVDRHEGVNDLGGRLNLTTTTKGAFTAKLQVGTVAYTGKGRLTITEESESPIVSVNIDFVKKGAPTLKAELVLDTALVSAQDFQVSGSLINAAVENATAALSGVRNTWTKTVKADRFKGDYTYGLSLPFRNVGVDGIPQGHGYGSLVITDKGVATFKGKTSDGKAFTVASIVGPQGHIPFFYSVAAVPGSLVAIPRVVVPETPSETALNSLDGTVSWSKKPVPEKSKERAYRAGFVEPVNLALLGGLYRQPAAGGVVAGLPDNGTSDTQVNARLFFVDGGLDEAVNVPTFGFTIMNKKDTGIKQTVIVAKPNPKDPANNPNPNSIAFKLAAKPAGYFSGTFTLPHETKSLVRKSTFEGTFVRHADGSFERVGFFLLPELPEGNGKLNTTPLQSGSVEVDAVAPVTGL